MAFSRVLRCPSGLNCRTVQVARNQVVFLIANTTPMSANLKKLSKTELIGLLMRRQDDMEELMRLKGLCAQQDQTLQDAQRQVSEIEKKLQNLMVEAESLRTMNAIMSEVMKSNGTLSRTIHMQAEGLSALARVATTAGKP